MTITHALILMVEKIALGSPFARIVTKARATDFKAATNVSEIENAFSEEDAAKELQDDVADLERNFNQIVIACVVSVEPQTVYHRFVFIGKTNKNT